MRWLLLGGGARLHVNRIVLGSILFALVLARPSGAALTITPPNVPRGFTVEDYCTAFPNGGPMTPGPIGIAFRSDGSVLITDIQNTSLYRLPSHADFQTLLPLNLVKAYAAQFPFGLAQLLIGGVWHYYGSGPDVIEIDPLNGNVLGTIAAAVSALGIVPFPPGIPSIYAGHLFSPGFNAGLPVIWDIDPVAKIKTVFINMPEPADGIAFTPDGSKILVACNANDFARAYSVATKAPIWVSPVHPGGYDGIAVGTGTLDGYVYVNSNSGDLWEFGVPWGPFPGVDNLLAFGGTRGDFIAVDPDLTTGGGTFPSLLLTQTDGIVRIDPPGGGWFGPPTSTMTPTTTDVGPNGEADLPDVIQVHPNPAVGPATIDFAVSRETHVRLSVVDVQGREVAVLADRPYGPGTHKAVWDGASSEPVSSGIYFVRLKIGDRTFMHRIARVR